MRERGLPTKLLAEKKKAPEELQEELSQLQEAKAPKTEVNTARNNVRNCRGRLRNKALKKHQSEWVRQRRDWKIDTRGKIRAEDDTKTDLENVLTKMMPARGRIATIMVSDHHGRKKKMHRGSMFAYIPGRDHHVLTWREPHRRSIPGQRLWSSGHKVGMLNTYTIQIWTNDCSLSNEQRNTYVHACRRKETAHILERSQSELRYYYGCFDWFVEEEWDEHCSIHLKSISSKRCGSITYCGVLLRPCYCPFCLRNDLHSASSKLRCWTKEDKLRDHLRSHLDICPWPLQCPHTLCNKQSDKESSFLCHLSDKHGVPHPRQTTRSG